VRVFDADMRAAINDREPQVFRRSLLPNQAHDDEAAFGEIGQNLVHVEALVDSGPGVRSPVY